MVGSLTTDDHTGQFLVRYCTADINTPSPRRHKPSFAIGMQFAMGVADHSGNVALYGTSDFYRFNDPVVNN